MEIKEREFVLKNGEKCLIFSPTEIDAKKLAEHKNIVRFETHFLMKSSSNEPFTEEREKIAVQEALASPFQADIVASVGGEIVGFCSGKRKNSDPRMQHRFEVALSVQKKHWSNGIGSHLLAAAIEVAKAANFEQIELSVASENEHAMRLYQKFGFVVFGKFPNSMKLSDGTYSSALFMVLDLKGNIQK